jgi:hypothetical protein
MTEKYRREGGSLFELNAAGDAYIHVFRNDRLARASLKRLIEAYQEHQDHEDMCRMGGV